MLPQVKIEVNTGFLGLLLRVGCLLGGRGLLDVKAS
jgi:hypothetical protein